MLSFKECLGNFTHQYGNKCAKFARHVTSIHLHLSGRDNSVSGRAPSLELTAVLVVTFSDPLAHASPYQGVKIVLANVSSPTCDGSHQGSVSSLLGVRVINNMTFDATLVNLNSV